MAPRKPIEPTEVFRPPRRPGDAGEWNIKEWLWCLAILTRSLLAFALDHNCLDMNAHLYTFFKQNKKKRGYAWTIRGCRTRARTFICGMCTSRDISVGPTILAHNEKFSCHLPVSLTLITLSLVENLRRYRFKSPIAAHMPKSIH